MDPRCIYHVVRTIYSYGVVPKAPDDPGGSKDTLEE